MTTTFAQSFAAHWVLFSMLGVALVVVVGSLIGAKRKGSKGPADPVSMAILIIFGLIFLCLFGGKSDKKR